MKLDVQKLIAFFLFLALSPGGRLDAQNQNEIATERFKTADADGSGGISQLEMKAYIKARLPAFTRIDEFIDRLDADNDQQISPKEFLVRQDLVAEMVAEDETEDMSTEPPTPTEFEDVFNARFLGQKPIVGDTIEDLVAFDGKGNKLDFFDLRGKYTVINFGCLT